MTSFNLPFSADILSKLFFLQKLYRPSCALWFTLPVPVPTFHHSCSSKERYFCQSFASKTIFLPNFDPTKKCLLIYIQNKISNKNNIFGSVTCTITTFVNWKTITQETRIMNVSSSLSTKKPACWRQDFLTRPFTFKNFHFIQIYTFTFQSNTFAFKTLYFHFS